MHLIVPFGAEWLTAISESAYHLSGICNASGKDTNYSTIKEYIEDYFRRHKKSTSRLIFEWVVALEYQINTDPIVDDKARVAISKDLARTYYRITREGLNLFNLGDEFVEKIFKSEYAN